MSQQSTTQTHSTSLVKALRILLALADSPDGRGVTNIAQALDLPKSAVHRLLVTFQELGFVQKQPKSLYTLGPAVVRLGLQAADMFAPRLVARPYLMELARVIEETVVLGVLHQGNVLLADKVDYDHILRVSPVLGSLLPLNQTAMGKLLVSYCDSYERKSLIDIMLESKETISKEQQLSKIHKDIEKIIQQDFFYDMETWINDIYCFAAPIRNSLDGVVAVVAVMLPTSRLQHLKSCPTSTDESPAFQYPTIVNALVNTAKRISTSLP